MQLTTGARTLFAKSLPKSTYITIIYDGIKYNAITHKIITGRIDGITNLFSAADFKIDYDPGRRTMEISKIK